MSTCALIKQKPWLTWPMSGRRRCRQDCINWKRRAKTKRGHVQHLTIHHTLLNLLTSKAKKWILGQVGSYTNLMNWSFESQFQLFAPVSLFNMNYFSQLQCLSRLITTREDSEIGRGKDHPGIKDFQARIHACVSFFFLPVPV